MLSIEQKIIVRSWFLYGAEMTDRRLFRHNHGLCGRSLIDEVAVRAENQCLFCGGRGFTFGYQECVRCAGRGWIDPDIDSEELFHE